METSAMHAFTNGNTNFIKSEQDQEKHKKVNLIMGFQAPDYSTTT